VFDFGIDRVMIVVGASVGVFVAGALAAPQFFPQAFASEPASHMLDKGKDLFPLPFDMKRLKRYDIVIDDSVSTDPIRTDVISKIGAGHKSIVSVITTSTGTYSSDALVSPYVLYPGITATRKHSHNAWTFSTFTSSWGTVTSSSVTVGSFTYYNTQVTPTWRHRT
jgi:hypothetical protein